MSGQVVKVSSATLQTLEHITKVLRYMYKKRPAVCDGLQNGSRQGNGPYKEC